MDFGHYCTLHLFSFSSYINLHYGIDNLYVTMVSVKVIYVTYIIYLVSRQRREGQKQDPRALVVWLSTLDLVSLGLELKIRLYIMVLAVLVK